MWSVGCGVDRVILGHVYVAEDPSLLYKHLYMTFM